MGREPGRTTADLELMYKNYQKKKEQIKVGTRKIVKGRCEVCEQQKSGLKGAYGHTACSSCRILMTNVRKRPESVIKYMQEVHGDKYFQAAAPVDQGNDQQWARGVIQAVRHAMGIEDGEDVEDLAGRVEAVVLDVEAQADIIRDLSSPEPGLLPDDISETGADIVIKCDMLKKMLLEKNKSCGDSALDPVRVFSRADPEEQLLVRIDDKLSRLSRGKEFAGDDRSWT